MSDASKAVSLGLGVAAGAAAAVVEAKLRERSEIQFPYNDLDDAVEVVSKMYQRSGAASCSIDQLAAWLGHETVNSGGFRNKIAATRYFGLIEVERQQISLTPLGREVLDPVKQKDAKRTAFLQVPLYKKLFERYRGRLLPPDVGLESDIRSLGVTPKQADKARQTFKRSAMQAGFFESGTDRLVLPASSAVPELSEDVDANEVPMAIRYLKRGGAELPSDLPLTLRLLLRQLPVGANAWTEADRREWLAAWEEVVLRFFPVVDE